MDDVESGATSLPDDVKRIEVGGAMRRDSSLNRPNAFLLVLGLSVLLSTSVLAGGFSVHRPGGGHFGGQIGGRIGGQSFGGRSFGGYSSGTRSYPRYHHYWNWGYYPLWASYGWLCDYPYYGSFYGPSFYGRGYRHAYGYYGGATIDPSRYARVDTDVNPDEAELWLDGKFVGTADDFDGFPDFLYLKPGKYHLEFKLPGHEGYSVDLDLQRGEMVNLNRKLKRLPGVGKLDSFPERKKGTPYGRVFGPGGAPDREMEDRERGSGYRRNDREDRNAPRSSAGVEMEDDDDMDQVEQPERSAPAPSPSHVEGKDGHRAPERFSDRPSARPRKGIEGRARLRWKVKPEDAAIYLDDSYLGIGEDLAGSARGTLTEPGLHSITVTRPGFKSKTVEIEAKASGSVDVEVNLER